MKAKTLLEEMVKHPLFSELQVGVFEWNEKEDVVGQFFPQDTPIILRRNFVRGTYIYSYKNEISSSQKADNTIYSEWEWVHLYKIEE